MGVTKEQLAAIIGGRAREMCSPQNDRKLNEMAGRAPIGGGYDPDPSSYDYDADRFDAMYSSNAATPINGKDIYYNGVSAAESRLPENIKQSMLQERIDVSGLGNTSVLDSMNIPQKPQPQQRTAPAPLVEQRQAAVGGVDYSVIKAIVNECLNEYFSKQPLNESASLKTIGISDGNIKLVDNKGTVYGAKLEKLGNVNNKKK